MKQLIDINCDLGEGFGLDHKLMPFIDSCNIACGGHYGDRKTIRDTIELALKHQVKIGAHPSFPDKENFGRKTLSLTSAQLEKSILEQMTLFLEACSETNATINHVKFHGALYNLAAKDKTTASTLLHALKQIPGKFSIYAPAGSLFEKMAREDFSVLSEAFIDRTYRKDGSLTPRSEANSTINNPEKAWKQLNQIISNEPIETSDGSTIELSADTFCVHGDSEKAPDLLTFIRKKLAE